MAWHLGSMMKLFLPNRQKRVCFSNPFNGRMWLNLLEPHQRYGLLFKKNLRYPKSFLGFSFATNEHGLRGPANRSAAGVILGTSFAMGLSVDNGSNWYDLAPAMDRWFNGGMPVGPQNHANLLDDLYTGSYDTLVYLYHPNLWKTAQGYVRAHKQGTDIFQTMGWKTDLWQTRMLYPKWIGKEWLLTSRGLSVHHPWQGQDYFFNARYCLMNLNSNLDFARSQMAVLNGIFSRFKTVLAVRLPIKEDLGAAAGFSESLKTLSSNYDEWWNFFAANVNPAVRTHELARSDFDAADFLPYDTHWSAAGNRKFAHLFSSLLSGTATDAEGEICR